MNRKIEEFVLRESKRNAESVWNAGWEVGYNKARAEYGMLRDERLRWNRLPNRKWRNTVMIW